MWIAQKWIECGLNWGLNWVWLSWCPVYICFFHFHFREQMSNSRLWWHWSHYRAILSPQKVTTFFLTCVPWTVLNFCIFRNYITRYRVLLVSIARLGFNTFEKSNRETFIKRLPNVLRTSRNIWERFTDIRSAKKGHIFFKWQK